MKSLTDMRSKLVGEIEFPVLPYVFIESVSINKASFMYSEDTPKNTTNEPDFVKNEFGTNKQRTSTRLSEGNKDPYQVTVTVSMNEFLNNTVWFGSSKASPIKIKILKATSKRAFDLIRSPSFRSAPQAPKNLRNHITEKIIQIPIDKPLSEYKVKEVENFSDILCTIKLKETFIVNEKYLGFVAFPYVEAPRLIGSKNSRLVMSGGKVNTKSYTYFSPDGTQWKGPVHRHPNKGIMEGKRHSSKPHSTLRVMEHSSNVKDYRIFDKFLAMQDNLEFKNKNQQDSRLYSDLFLSPDPTGAVRGFFAFDMVGFLSKNSEFNSFVNKSNLKKLMALTRIQNLTVYREQQNDFDGGETEESNLIKNSNKTRETIASFYPVGRGNRRISPTLNTIDDNNDGVPDKTIGSVMELTVSGLGNKRGFSFVDIDMANREGGSYLYGVEMTIQDPTINFFRTQLFSLREARNIITSYQEQAKQKNNFNRNTSEFSHAFLNDLKIKNNLGINNKGLGSKKASVPWRIAPKMYFTVLENFSGSRLSKSDKKSLQKLLYPSTGDLKGVEMFVGLLDRLIKKLESAERFPTEASLGNNINKGFLTAAGSKTPSTLDASLREEKTFISKPWRATKYKDSTYQLNYLDGAIERTQYGLVEVNRASLMNRFNVEAGKYFPELVGKREDQVTDPMLAGFRSVYFSNLTPSSIQTEQGDIVLSRKINDSYTQATRALASVSTKQDTLLRQLGVSIIKRRTNENKPSTISTSQYFGDNSNFKNTLQNKDSFADRVKNILADEVVNRIADVSSKHQSSPNKQIGSESSLQQRYIQKINDGGASEEVKNELNVIRQTTVGIRYIIGFDSNMQPIYSTKVPHAARPSIYVLESRDNSLDSGEKLYLVNDSVGVISTAGQSMTAEDLGEDKNLISNVMSLRVPEKTASRIEIEEPCPEGYQFNFQVNACVAIPGFRAEAASIDDTDPVTADTEYGLGQYYQSPDTLKAVSSPSQQQTQASRTGPTPVTRTQAATTAPISTGGGGGGSYGY